ncbi:putative F420-0 ABC transporter substrate-binding protein [Desertivibrio insolitus]|uniref:putative F420-0 ABC transporter substrate-binding protein n=1 Tax=Herbiconiux sp. SYSU D00978 TaxID=2812562 RepID=UPI0027DAB57B|nr:putative F420-0 ABC transporter substrate-binding protein [Herbiconiux sp. SYSU D00978]
MPRPVSAVLAAASLLLLTGCSTVAAPAEPAAEGTAAAASVDNCGTEVPLGTAPERIVTIKSTSTELLLALGLGDRVVGRAFPDGPVPEEWADEAESIPVISDFVPSQEAVLELEPDFVFGGWESNFSADGAGERDELAALGIRTYVSPAACQEEGYQPDPLTFDVLFDELLEAGRVFGAEDAAERLVDEQRAELEAIEPDDRGLTAVWWSSGEDTPYVGAGIGAPQMILDAAGLTNIAEDIPETWSSLSLEAIVEADPDVLVLVDAEWNTAESKIAALQADPATAALQAVQQRRYVIVPFAAGEGGVRNVEAAASIVEQLEALPE